VSMMPEPQQGKSRREKHSKREKRFMAQVMIPCPYHRGGHVIVLSGKDDLVHVAAELLAAKMPFERIDVRCYHVMVDGPSRDEEGEF
jgi:hypothetical protein